MKLTNYVLIRFSLRLKPEWAAKAYGDESNRDAWFGMRAKIFKEYLYQSLSEQTTPPYKVIVFMDEGDADLWAKHLNLPPPFSPHYCSGNNLNENTRQILLSGPQDNIVLSRIDSDDAISRDYLESINASAMEAVKNGNNKKHIVAANGFITNLNEIQAIYYNCSPFISLYVRSYDGEVIYDIAHETILSRNPLINLGKV